MEETQALVKQEFSQDQVELIKRTICKGSTDDELKIFLQQCKRTGLDPFSRQIHAVKRWDSSQQREVMSIQTGIDGFRLIADRTGKYEGQTSPLWCGKDGQWVDIWLEDEPPMGAKVGVMKSGCQQPFWGIARWKSYVQTKKDGTATQFWQKMGPDMLAKCAEALAFRKGFPNELSGLYTNEEMAQAGNDASHNNHSSPPQPQGSIEGELLESNKPPDLWAHEPPAAAAPRVSKNPVPNGQFGPSWSKEIGKKKYEYQELLNDPIFTDEDREGCFKQMHRAETLEAITTLLNNAKEVARKRAKKAKEASLGLEDADALSQTI